MSCLTFFSSLSEETAKLWLDVGEIGLLIASLIVVVGVIGEMKKFDDRQTLHAIAEFLVILGVAGELIADGIVYKASSRLQTIQESEIANTKTAAATALRKVADMGLTFDNLDKFVKQKQQNAEARFNELKEYVAAEDAKNASVITEFKNDKMALEKARAEAIKASQTSEKVLADMNDALAKERALQQKMITVMSPRTLTAKQHDLLVKGLNKINKPFSVMIVRIGEQESMIYADDIITALKQVKNANLNILRTMQTYNPPQYGVQLTLLKRSNVLQVKSAFESAGIPISSISMADEAGADVIILIALKPVTK